MTPEDDTNVAARPTEPDADGGNADDSQLPDASSEPPDSCAGSASRGLSCLNGVLALMVLALVLRFLVPGLVQEMRFAWLRGQQRAEFEQAGDTLAQDPLKQLSGASQLVSKRVGPSVVNIDTERVERSGTPIDESAHLFGFAVPRRSQGQGSGVIIDAEGFILTNNHVIDGATRIQIALSDGRTVPATVIGVDALTDLAVLKIEAPELIAAEWGDSDALEEGALVWALGSPFGLEHSVTFGILSAKNRAGMAGNPHQDFLQTDAAVNPGNSGGPLVDARGRVIGINSAIVGQTYRGISFAIPSSVARQVYQQLVTQRRVPRGWLGVALAEVTPELAQGLGLSSTEGAVISAVVTDPNGPSPAQAAGLRPKDVVVRWDGHDVESPSSLSRLVARTEIGRTVEVIVIRDGERLELDVTVGDRPT